MLAIMVDSDAYKEMSASDRAKRAKAEQEKKVLRCAALRMSCGLEG